MHPPSRTNDPIGGLARGGPARGEVVELRPGRPQPHGALLRATRAELLARRQASVLALLAELLDGATLQSALDAFAGALQHRFALRRATVALADESGALRLGAVSGRTLVDVGSAEVRLLLAAMEESAAQERTVRFPCDDHALGTLAAHRALVAARPGSSVASVPLHHDGALIGALLLERDDVDAFSAPTLDLLERVALVAAPQLAVRCEAERGALSRLRRDLGGALDRRFGASRPGARLVLAAGIAAVALAGVFPVDRHVRAAAELVPHERRLVTAPVAGFVDEVRVRAGERVEAGQLLARLDRRELELEAAREDGEVRTAEAGLRAAMAGHDRLESAIARAELEQERAQRALVEHRLARGELRAPVAGLIASGDPLDAVGAPVARGDALFEIVPDGSYEVHLLVDARDIRDVAEGQAGELELEARPGERLALAVRTIHPVAESGDGTSRFRVRASVAVPDGITLRPGESGLARLQVGRTRLLARLARPLGRRLAELRWRLLG